MLTLLTLLTLLFTFTCVAYAAEPAETVSVVTEDLGNGFTAVVTTTVSHPMARTSYVDGNRTWDISYLGSKIGSVSLTVRFSYNGSSATAMQAVASHSASSGWSYSNEKVTCSGNKGTISAKFSKNGSSTSINKSISCSPMGVIS